MSQQNWSLYSQFIYMSRYARYVDKEKRRETWEETVGRYFDFLEEHMAQNHSFSMKDIRPDLEKAVLARDIMPAMRGLMTAGPALKRDEAAVFNCAYLPIDSFRSLDEMLYTLMLGTGVGFSVESENVLQLHSLPDEFYESDTTIVFDDSRIGWAKGYKEYVALLSNGQIAKYDVSKIRPAGARLKTFGGRASGPQPLIELLDFTRNLFVRAAGRRLTPIEVHDICCMIGYIVVVGGVRRAAEISLSDLNDDKMRDAKSGNWHMTHPYRRLANNSAVYEEKPDIGIFMKEWLSLYNSKSGERGIISRKAIKRVIENANEFRRKHHAELTNGHGEPRYRDSKHKFGVNPCFTGDTLIAVADGRNSVSIKELAETGNEFPVYSARRALNNQNAWVTEVKRAVAFKTGVRKVIEVILSDGTTVTCTPDHRLALHDGGYIAAAHSKGYILEGFNSFLHKKNYRLINSVYKYQHRMIWEYYNGKKMSGYHIDHVISDGNDSITNLQLLSQEDHGVKTSHETKGQNNAVHKIKDREAWLNGVKRNTFFSKNPNYSGISDEEIIGAAIFLMEEGAQITFTNLRVVNPRIPQFFSKNRFGGNIQNLRDIVYKEVEYVAPQYSPDHIERIEDVPVRVRVNPTVVEIRHSQEMVNVYDLTVDDNHNFFIVTNERDERGIEASGILVHNCAEILLRPYQFCNLTSVQIMQHDTEADLIRKVKLATILGTLQSCLTNFRYLNKKWQRNCEDERLLGVSLNGIYDNRLTNGSHGHLALGKLLEKMKLETIRTNLHFSHEIGINSSVAITCVKPEGTTSAFVGTSSGIHPAHSPFYIRHVTNDIKDPVTSFMIDRGFPYEKSYYDSKNTVVFKFPIKSSPDAVFRKHLGAIEHLEMWKTYQIHYCEHKPSVTISVKEEEWLQVGSWVYDNFEWASGISFLPAEENGIVYKQAPFSECTESQYKDLLSQMPVDVDWSELNRYELEDSTTNAQEFACVGSQEGCAI